MTDVMHSTQELAQARSFDEAARLAGGFDQVARISDVIGGGEVPLSGDDKGRLVGVAFLILDYRWITNDKSGREYVSLTVVTANEERYIVNDGGSGIPSQVEALKEADAPLPIFVPKGLRRSTYDHPTAGPSTTYYLDTAR